MNTLYKPLPTCILLGWLFGTLLSVIPLSGLSQTKLCVQTISVVGAKKTKEQVILRELSFQKGDTIDANFLPEFVERNKQNIFNLGLFNEVIIDPLPLMNDIHFIITVKERWYIFPIPKLIVEERNSYDLIQAITEGNFRRLAYGLDLTWDNLTGRNESLDFYGQLGFSERIRARLTIPAIFGQRYTDITMGYSYISNNEIITGTEDARVVWQRTEEPLQESHTAQFGVRKRFDVYQSINAWVTYRAFSFSDSLSIYNPTFVPDGANSFNYPSFTVQYRNDQRDWHSFPLKGYRYQLMARYTGPPGISDTENGKLGFTWAHHIPLSKKWNFAYGTHNILTIGKNIPFLEKSAIGISRGEFSGISSNLRGYQRYVVDGSFIHMTKAEFKFALVPYRFIHIKQIPFKKFQDMPFGLYLSAFIDTGYIQDNTINNQDILLKDQWLTGYGIGLNLIAFYDRLLRIEFARNHLGDNGIYFHSSVPIR